MEYALYFCHINQPACHGRGLSATTVSVLSIFNLSIRCNLFQFLQLLQLLLFSCLSCLSAFICVQRFSSVLRVLCVGVYPETGGAVKISIFFTSTNIFYPMCDTVLPLRYEPSLYLLPLLYLL